MADVLDFETITGRQQSMWAAGDFNVIALGVMQVSEDLVRKADPHPGRRVLDVACGSGNAALVAARRYCEVSGLDYVPALIERAKSRASAEGTTIDFRVGDAQALPYPDAHFDFVLSVFGVMFAPDQARAARELLRVCKPGGTIALANWVPSAFADDFFKAVSTFMPPPPGLTSPLQWGTEQGLQELLGGGTSSIRSERRTFFQYYHTVEHMADVLRKYFGPLQRAFEMTPVDGHPALQRAVIQVLEHYNRATDGTAAIESQYRQVIAVRAR
jgi:SAM-dependent methyltransferase